MTPQLYSYTRSESSAWAVGHEASGTSALLCEESDRPPHHLLRLTHPDLRRTQVAGTRLATRGQFSGTKDGLLADTTPGRFPVFNHRRIPPCPGCLPGDTGSAATLSATWKCSSVGQSAETASRGLNTWSVCSYCRQRGRLRSGSGTTDLAALPVSKIRPSVTPAWQAKNV